MPDANGMETDQTLKFQDADAAATQAMEDALANVDTNAEPLVADGEVVDPTEAAARVEDHEKAIADQLKTAVDAAASEATDAVRKAAEVTKKTIDTGSEAIKRIAA